VWRAIQRKAVQGLNPGSGNHGPCLQAALCADVTSAPVRQRVLNQLPLQFPSGLVVFLSDTLGVRSIYRLLYLCDHSRHDLNVAASSEESGHT